MDNKVIQAENLGKVYRIGLKEQVNDTLVSTMFSWIKAPVRSFQNLRNLDTYNAASDSEDLIWALHDVSFEVKQGEVLGIIGRNGAGKSTLLKILSRVTNPTTGKVVIKGRVGSLLEVGTGFHPELTGRENVYMNGVILGMKKGEIDSKFDEIVEFSGVEKFLDTPIKRYSSGMRVRLAFAVAAHLEPEILIVDEVLAVGDVEFQKKCLSKMGDVAKEGQTILLVSHNMGAVSSLCSHCLLLKDGRLAAYGDTNRIIPEYLEQPASTGVPLSERTDRIGDRSVEFVDCWLSDSPSGNPLKDFLTGDDMYIGVRLKAEERKEVWLAVTIRDGMETKIMCTSNRLCGLPPHEIQGEETFFLHIPKCALLEGEYSVELSAVIARKLERADVIGNALRFNILPKDIHASNQVIGSYFGVVHLPHQWLGADMKPISKKADS